MRGYFGEPASARFDELQFMKTGAFFFPSWTLTRRLNPVNQTLAHPSRISFPRDIRNSVVNMDRTWLAIQSHSLNVKM